MGQLELRIPRMFDCQAKMSTRRVVRAGRLTWTSFSFNDTRFTMSRRAILSGLGFSR